MLQDSVAVELIMIGVSNDVSLNMVTTLDSLLRLHHCLSGYDNYLGMRIHYYQNGVVLGLWDGIYSKMTHFEFLD